MNASISITPDAVQAVAQKLLDSYSSEYANDFDWTEFAGQAAELLEAALPHLRGDLPALPEPPPVRPRDPQYR